jgi:hypothetical protein
MTWLPQTGALASLYWIRLSWTRLVAFSTQVVGVLKSIVS